MIFSRGKEIYLSDDSTAAGKPRARLIHSKTALPGDSQLTKTFRSENLYKEGTRQGMGPVAVRRPSVFTEPVVEVICDVGTRLQAVRLLHDSLIVIFYGQYRHV